MLGDTCADILEQAGFKPIGTLSHRMHLGIWWHDEAKIEVVILQLGSKILLKGHKVYYLQSITEEGQTWARDIRQLHDYLENHFPEMHLSFSQYRDVSGTLAAQHIKRKHAVDAPRQTMPSPQRLGKLQRSLDARRREQSSFDHLLEEGVGDDLLSRHLRHQQSSLSRQIHRLEQQTEREQDELAILNQLQRQYRDHGAAVCLTFSVSSNLHLVNDPDSFRDALDCVVKELGDAHRYQVSQKLGGGKLNIQVAESQEPVMSWIELWFGGALSPRQMERIEPDLALLQNDCAKHQMVVPKEDIRVDGRVYDDQKRLGARVVSSLLDRVDRSDVNMRHAGEWPTSSYPLRLGSIVRDGKPTQDSAAFPLGRFHHGYLSGKTGFGKSYAWRVIVEEATEYKGLSILVLDPRNQAVGLLVPEDRETIFESYSEHGMTPDQAQGYRFDYYAPGQDYGKAMPSDLGALAKGRSIVSFRGMEDARRCELFAQILDAAFNAYAGEEAETPRLLVVVEEAHRFTKKQVVRDAKEAGEQAEMAMDRFLREGRKYGLCMLVVSQSHRDFAYGAAGIRQNTATKFFLHNSDREAEYAADFVGDGRQILRLPTATAIACNPAWGVVTVRFRPPHSKVWEYSDADTRRLFGRPKPAVASISGTARRALDFVRQVYERDGRGPNLSALGDALGISSKRSLQDVVRQLERAQLVRTRRLNERGQPRVIEPIVSAADQTPDAMRTKADETLNRRTK